MLGKYVFHTHTSDFHHTRLRVFRQIQAQEGWSEEFVWAGASRALEDLESASFWVKSSQKNLIAIFFQLPAKPVKIGDKWSLDINLIANDQNFECDSAYKINEVTLTDIKKVNGETKIWILSLR